MKKFIISGILMSLFVVVFAFNARAQMMNYGATGTPSATGGQTAQEEAQGKIIWEQLQSKTTTCANLKDEDFYVLGEYFMGQMMGSSHEAMNTIMVQQLGTRGETQMHIVMGKRLSGCDTSAAYSAGGIGFMPMMQMMWGGWSSPFGYNSMMNFEYGFSFSSWIFAVASIAWLIVGILAIVLLWKKIKK